MALLKEIKTTENGDWIISDAIRTIYVMNQEDVNEILKRLKILESFACIKAQNAKFFRDEEFYGLLWDNATVCIRRMEMPENIRGSDDLKIVYEFDELSEYALFNSLYSIKAAFMRKIANCRDVNDKLEALIRVYNKFNECIEMFKKAKWTD